MNISRNPAGAGTLRLYPQIRSKQGFSQVTSCEKTFDLKQVRNTQVHLNKSRKKVKEDFHKPKKQKLIDTFSYPENIASASI